MSSADEEKLSKITPEDFSGKSPVERLKELWKEFPEDHILKLPQPTIKREQYQQLQKKHCNICGGYHPEEHTIHLSYVGHAPLTARLLSVDPQWTWEPMAFDDRGLPAFDKVGGLWIWLTICGVKRPGYGDCGGKVNANGVKEAIGDALRNGAMRFGCALDLWFKGEGSLFNEPEQITDHMKNPPPAGEKPAENQPAGESGNPREQGSQGSGGSESTLSAERAEAIRKKIYDKMAGDGLNPIESDHFYAWVVEDHSIPLVTFINQYSDWREKWIKAHESDTKEGKLFK